MRKIILFVVLLGLVAFAVPSNAKDKDVNVVNTPDVNVANTPDVNVNGTVAAEIVNTSSNAVPVEIVNGSSGGSSEYRFIGFTDDDPGHVGNIGLNGLYAACQEDFGASARMCTSEEVIGSPEIATYSFIDWEFAWVQPVIKVAVFDGTDVLMYDASGELAIDCLGWATNSPSAHGLVVGKLGGSDRLDLFSPSSCDDARQVACCVPR